MTYRSLKTSLKKIAAVATTTALTATGFVALSVAATIPNTLPTHAAGLGGPVQLDGMDPVCHSTGESTGQYIAAVLKSLHDTASIAGNDGSIAILGTNVWNACGASFNAGSSNDVEGQYLNSFDASSKPSWSLHSDGSAIDTFFADLSAGTIHPKVIWIPDEWDRPAGAEASFSAHAEDIANFVNAGGGLFANNGSYGWLSTLLPNAQFVGGGCNGGPALSTDGRNAFPNLTDQMVTACWHGSFWGSYPGLVSLVEWPYDALGTGANPTPMAPVAIGGANVTMPTSFKLETNPSQAIHSDTVDVIASTIALDGTIYSGVTVSYSVTSGPHAGWTASAVTGVDGKAHATLTFVADGADVIEASATVNGVAKTQTYTIQWAEAFTPVRFTDSVLGTMTEGTPYSNGIAADGRPAPTYTVTAGALPAGLALDSATGAITGTPSAAGPFSFEITATNSAGSAVKTFTGSVNAGVATAPSWSDTTLGTMSVDSSYSDAVAASGSPAPTYAITAGALPAGLSLDSATGAITGTPTAAGSYEFEVTASNSQGSIAQTFSGSVEPPASTVPVWTDITIGDIALGVAFSDAVAAEGTPVVTYAITAGALPAGLSLDSATGAITGTPSEAGSYSFTITASTTAGSVSQSFSGSVADPTPSWSDSTIGDFSLAVPYSNGVEAASSQSVTYSITAGALPAGLSLDSATGAITGTPSEAGSYSFTITATADGTSPALEVSLTFEGTVEDTTPIWSDSSLGDIHAGVPYSDGLSGNSSIPVTYSVTAGALPAGLSLDPATGAITGTVDAPGAYSFTITATSDGGSVSRTFSGSVIATPPTVGDSSVKNGVVGSSYSDGVSAAANGSVTYSVTAGALPAGLSLDSATGAITGTPTAAGTYSFTITASSINGSIDITVTIQVASLSFEPVKDTVNTGSDTGSLDFSSAPLGSSISVTPPKSTEDRVAGTASIVGSTVVYAPNTGFSGYAKVIVTVTVNGVSQDREYTFTVNPTPVGTGEYSNAPAAKEAAWLSSPRASGSTTISWTASPNAIGYEVVQVPSVSSTKVRAKGTMLCTTTATSCTVKAIAGPGSSYQVIAIGRDNLKSQVITAGYKRPSSKRGTKALFTQFSMDSARISTLGKKELRALALQIKTGGFTKVLLIGNTDERGSVWYNNGLGQRRANAVKTYLSTLVGSGVTITTVSKGSREPLSQAGTAAARTLNRRTDAYLS